MSDIAGMFDRIEEIAREMGIPVFPDLPPTRRMSERALWPDRDLEAFLDIGRRAGVRLFYRSRRVFHETDLAEVEEEDVTLAAVMGEHVGEVFECWAAWTLEGVLHTFHVIADWHRDLHEALGEIEYDDEPMSDAELEEDRRLAEEEERREAAREQAARKVAHAEGFSKVRKTNEATRRAFARKIAPDFVSTWRDDGFDLLVRTIFDDEVQPAIDRNNAVLRDRLLAEGSTKKATRLKLGLTETEYDKLEVSIPPELGT